MEMIILILGALGIFGFACAIAMVIAGWQDKIAERKGFDDMANSFLNG